ncbi:MAG TPA: hypothetical protein VEX13_00265 [Chloroflexia bacterium]|nr:hypothetical protein [Chloroflexia bacterium]
MAKVTLANLNIQENMIVGDNLKVTVTYKVAFSAEEAGEEYKLAIELFGHDPIGDEETPNPTFLPPKLLYTFGFGPPALSKKYKVITAVAGTQTFPPEERQVSKVTLDEDPLSYDVGGKYTTKTIPHPDEVFAVVSIIHQKRSVAKAVPPPA